MKEAKKIRVWDILIRLTPQIVKASPVIFGAVIILQVLHGLAWGLEIVMEQRFFDQAVLFSQGVASFGMVFLALGALGLVSIMNQVLNGVSNFVPEVLGNIVGASSQRQSMRK